MPDASPATTPASATLARIRERAELAASALAARRGLNSMADSAEDVPALLKAVETVLAPHQPGRIVVFGATCERHEAHRHFSIDAREAADARACPDCAATVYRSCTGCGPGVSADACPVRETITTALAGKDSSSDGQ